MTPSTDTAQASPNWFQRVFREHPASVGESYGVHFLFALRFAGVLFGAAFAALIHAFIPALCEKTASTRIHALHDALSNRVK